jgi:hypothetical protein
LDDQSRKACRLYASFVSRLCATGYAFGAVQIPVGKVMNWVGNVDTREAAGNLLA